MAWLGLVMAKHAELPSRGYLYQNSNFSVVKWTMEPNPNTAQPQNSRVGGPFHLILQT
jgi:hypothetical protein